MFARNSLQSLHSLVFLAVSMVVLSSPQALADRQGPGFASFAQQVREIQSVCNWSQQIANCAEIDVTVDVIPVSALAPGVVSRLAEITLDQVNVWGDTILEGDLVLRSDAAIVQVEVIRRAGQLVSYRVIYQAHAYDSLESHEGMISEATWIHPALALWFRDDRSLARFVQN